MEIALQAQGLTRTFGDLVAVDRIDLNVPSGSFYGFLGPNGAGKSTTMKCLTGLLRPTAGQISILGLDPWAHPVEVKRQLGVVPEDLALFDRLSAQETLAFVGQVHGLQPEMVRSRIDELLEVMDLATATDALVADFSHGMRKKLSLAVALLPAPRMLFLDEPFEGIDVVASQQIRRLLLSFVKGGGTVFLTSHILEIVERLCDHVGIIAKGQIVAEGSISELGGDSGGNLESIFMERVGAGDTSEPQLDWLNA